ncbi:hypothetical protein B0T13DRAFT_17313 [Neurospora crassa]|nr:hypothetical protein B0T13DRAFT_17313 [Neurospora crassa]
MFRSGYRTWTPRPSAFVLVPPVSNIDGFCLAANPLPTVASGGRLRLEPMVPVVLQSGNSRYRFGKSFCSTCTISRFHLPTWAWADRLAPCLPLCPSSTTAYLDGSLTLHTSRFGFFCYRNADRAGQVSLLDLEILRTGIQAVSIPNDGLSKSSKMLWHRGMVDQAP